MTNNLRNTLFGFRTRRAAEAFAAFKATNTPSAFNESGTTVVRPRRPRIVGITEQRLRAHHQASWITRFNAWRKVVAWFTTPGARTQTS